MMLPDSFVHPWVLMLLVVPVALVLFGRTGRPLTLPFDHRPHRRRRWLRWGLAATSTLPAILLALAIILLARPQRLQQPRALRSVTNIQICLDVSGSMGFFSGRRYQLAARAIENFTRAREGDAMGLTLFGGEQVRWIPLTKDLQAIRNALPFANPDQQPEHMQSTAIAACLRFVCRNIEAEALEGDRLIILVSDGESPDMQGGRQYELARELNDARCVLYYVHVADDIAMIPEVAELARETGGEGLTATDKGALADVFNHINRMQPARIVPQGKVEMDDVRLCAATGVVALLLQTIALLGLRYTPW